MVEEHLIKLSVASYLYVRIDIIWICQLRESLPAWCHSHRGHICTEIIAGIGQFVPYDLQLYHRDRS